jgi:hypothetical protein
MNTKNGKPVPDAVISATRLVLMRFVPDSGFSLTEAKAMKSYASNDGRYRHSSRAAGLSLALYRANDRGQDRIARAPSNCLGDYATDTEVAGLCRRHN